MTGRPATSGGDAYDQLGIKPHGFGGREIVGKQNSWGGDIRDARLWQTAQLANRAVANIVEVGDTFSHVAAEACEELRVVLNGIVNCLGDAGARLEFLHHGLGERPIGSQLRSGLQNRACLRAGVLSLLLQRLCDVGHRRADALTIGDGIGRRRLLSINSRGGEYLYYFSAGRTGRDTDAIDDSVLLVHCFRSPFRDLCGETPSVVVCRGVIQECFSWAYSASRSRSSMAASSSRAAAAESSSQLSVTSSPCLAPRVMTSRIEAASASSSSREMTMS